MHSVYKTLVELCSWLQEKDIQRVEDNFHLNETLEEIKTIFREQPNKEDGSSESLRKNHEDERYISFDTLLQNMKESVSLLHEIKDNICAIMQWDILHRIEFLQIKTAFLEYLIQENLFPEEEQKTSERYLFIMRMRHLFPLMDCKVQGNDTSHNMVRIGRDMDGGYIMLGDLSGRKYAYSFGISNDVSWDKDIAAYGLDVYMYDHTISALPEENERFHFFKTGLGAYPGAYPGESPDLKTLSQLMENNGHLEEYRMILKIDIEGAEWKFLNTIDSTILKHFSQIVFEFHGLNNPENERKITTAIQKLNSTHQLIHLHGNNCGSYMFVGGKILPDTIEATYLLKDEYEFLPRNKSVLTSLDKQCSPYTPEISLGNWTD